MLLRGLKCSGRRAAPCPCRKRCCGPRTTLLSHAQLPAAKVAVSEQRYIGLQEDDKELVKKLPKGGCYGAQSDTNHALRCLVTIAKKIIKQHKAEGMVRKSPMADVLHRLEQEDPIQHLAQEHVPALQELIEKLLETWEHVNKKLQLYPQVPPLPPTQQPPEQQPQQQQLPPRPLVRGDKGQRWQDAASNVAHAVRHAAYIPGLDRVLSSINTRFLVGCGMDAKDALDAALSDAEHRAGTQQLQAGHQAMQQQICAVQQQIGTIGWNLQHLLQQQFAATTVMFQQLALGAGTPGPAVSTSACSGPAPSSQGTVPATPMAPGGAAPISAGSPTDMDVSPLRQSDSRSVL